MLSEPGVLFAHWIGDTTGSSPRTVLFVNSHKAIKAEWVTIARTHRSNYFDVFVTTLPAMIIFAISLVLNLRRR
jgi:hypothetical protein